MSKFWLLLSLIELCCCSVYDRRLLEGEPPLGEPGNNADVAFDAGASGGGDQSDQAEAGSTAEPAADGGARSGADPTWGTNVGGTSAGGAGGGGAAGNAGSGGTSHSGANTSGSDGRIGNGGFGFDYFMTGAMDEVRIDNAARNTAYIVTEFNNQRSRSTFIKTIGAAEAAAQH